MKCPLGEGAAGPPWANTHAPVWPVGERAWGGWGLGAGSRAVLSSYVMYNGCPVEDLALLWQPCQGDAG